MVVVWSLRQWLGNLSGNMQDKVLVEEGVPTISKNRRDKYPWRRMQLGQTFYVPATDKVKVMNSLTSARGYAQQQTGFRFSLRSEEYGIRVRRTA